MESLIRKTSRESYASSSPTPSPPPRALNSTLLLNCALCHLGIKKFDKLKYLRCSHFFHKK